MDATFLCASILLLIAANGFFVAAEFALVKTRGSRIETPDGKGGTAAAMVLRIQRNLEAYVTTCQLGVTMASLGLGWVGGFSVAIALQHLFHPPGVPDAILDTAVVVVGFLVLSSLHLLVGQRLPRNFAVRRPEPVSLWLAYPLHLAYLALRPLNWLLRGSDGPLMGPVGTQGGGSREVRGGGKEKRLGLLRNCIDDYQPGWAEKLHNLSADDRRTIDQVMVPRERVHTLDLARHPDDNLLAICEADHRCFPVVDSGDSRRQIVGVLYARDFFNAILDSDDDRWRDLRRCCREPPVVPPSQRVSELSELMPTKRAHMALVADASGTLAGIVTPSDLAERAGAEIPGDRELSQETPDL